MEIEVSFGSWVMKRRKALDFTREELAREVGCSVSGLRKIESDERRPSKQLAELLAAHLNIPAEERAKFIRIARGERSAEALPSLNELPNLNQLKNTGSGDASLPAPLTPLVGREHELGALQQMLADPQYRLITLVGPGGIGKTRVAIAISSLLSEAFAHGTHLIQLASLQSPELILPAITDSLGVSFHSAGDPKANLFAYLRDKQLLLVMDNMEHLLEGAGLLAEMLRATPGVKIVCTSREPLNLSGEWVFEIGGLQVPEHEDEEDLERFSATALFLGCARRVQGGAELAGEDKPLAVRICRLVNGMPLAIELAAGWIKVLSCSEIAQEIQASLDFLSSNARDLPPRHRSLRAVFDHTWQLLSAEEQRILMSLSVLPGSFTRQAASEISGASLELLSSLVSKSLLQRVETGRFQLHELIRQFALEYLQARPGAVQEVRDRHSDYYLGLMRSVQQSTSSSGARGTSPQLTIELHNLRAAWEWAVSRHRLDRLGAHEQIELRLDWGTVLEFAGRWQDAEAQYLAALESSERAGDAAWTARCQWSLGRLNRLRDELEEALQWLQKAEVHAEASASRLDRCRVLVERGFIYSKQGQYAEAQAQLEKSLEISKASGDRGNMAWSVYHMGLVAWYRQDGEAAQRYYEESLALFKELDDKLGIAWCLNDLGSLAFRRQDMHTARAYLEESLELRRQIGEKQGIAMVLTSLGATSVYLKDEATARRVFSEALVLSREIGDRVNVARLLNWLGYIAHTAGKHREAEARYRDSLAVARVADNKRGMGVVLTNLGHLALDEGQTEQAQQAYVESLCLSQEVGDIRNAGNNLVGLAAAAARQERMQEAALLAACADQIRVRQKFEWEIVEKRFYEDSLRVVRAELSEAAFQDHWEKGSQLSLNQALELVRSDL